MSGPPITLVSEGSRTFFPVTAAVGVRRPLPQNPGFGHGSGAIPVGAALAATRPLQSAGFDAGSHRGQDPCHRTPARAPAAGRARSQWERPWPRCGRCNPPASMRAAIGVKTPATEPGPVLRPQGVRDLRWSSLGRDAAAAIRRLRCRPQSGSRPLPQNPGPGSGRRSGAISVGAALAATRPLQSADFDAGSHRGQDPCHRTPARAPAAGRARFSWERPWPRRGRCNPPASMRAAIGVKTPATKHSAPPTEPLTQRTHPGISPTYFHGPRLRSAPDAAGLV